MDRATTPAAASRGLGSRGAAALLGLLLLLPMAPALVRQTAFALQAESLTARLDHRVAIDEVSWTASYGPSDADYLIATVVLEQTEHDGRRIALGAAPRERLKTMAESGAELIAEWSEERHTARLLLRSTPIPVTLDDDLQGGLWPNPGEVATIAEGLFGDLRPDLLLVLWGDGGQGLTGAAGLASHRTVFGRDLPYLAITDPGVDARRLAYPGEILVHEFCHALEFFADRDGERRPDLHHPEVYGFHDLWGSYADWYRFFFAHPTEARAQAALRAPKPAVRASNPPFGFPRTPILHP